MTIEGSMRQVKVKSDSEFVVKQPLEDNREEGVAANERELAIYKRNINNLCLCPIDLDKSCGENVVMAKAATYDILSMDSNQRIETLLKQVFNPTTYHDNCADAADLSTTLAKLIINHLIELPAAIDFITDLEQLYSNTPNIFDDLHCENIGVLDKRPVIIDYAGWK